jgi:hypothetical protein
MREIVGQAFQPASCGNGRLESLPHNNGSKK